MFEVLIPSPRSGESSGLPRSCKLTELPVFTQLPGWPEPNNEDKELSPNSLFLDGLKKGKGKHRGGKWVKVPTFGPFPLHTMKF